MEKFSKFLISKDIIPEKQVPDYVGWVKAFLRSRGRDASEKVTAEEIDRYVKNLARRTEDWQVRQAEQALRIFRYYQGRTQAPENSGANAVQQWKIVSREMKNMIRLKQLSVKTEKTYISWLRQFYRFLQGASPYSLDSAHITNFLTWLAVDRNIAASTQNQAFNAILFFYRHVLEKEVGQISEVVRSRKRQWLPQAYGSRTRAARLIRKINFREGITLS